MEEESGLGRGELRDKEEERKALVEVRGRIFVWLVCDSARLSILWGSC